MSVKLAMKFLGRARVDAEVRRQVEALGRDAALGDLLAIAAGAGFMLAEEDLRGAFQHDWTLRLAAGRRRPNG